MYYSAPPQDDYSGAVLCLVIFLILMLIFRGAQSRKNCIVYLQDDSPAPPVVSYAETPKVPDTPKEITPKQRPRELGNPTKAGLFSRY